jgi:hypothetical protein
MRDCALGEIVNDDGACPGKDQGERPKKLRCQLAHAFLPRTNLGSHARQSVGFAAR